MRFSNRGNRTVTTTTREDEEEGVCTSGFIKVPMVTRRPIPSRSLPVDRIDDFRARWLAYRTTVLSSLIQINRFMHRRDLERPGEKKPTVPGAQPDQDEWNSSRVVPPYLRCIPLEPCPHGYRLPREVPAALFFPRSTIG